AVLQHAEHADRRAVDESDPGQAPVALAVVPVGERLLVGRIADRAGVLLDPGPAQRCQRLDVVVGGRPNRHAQSPPPLARRFWAVIHRPSGPARKATTSATSAGCPRRPSGLSAGISATSAGSLALRSMSVSVAPGETTLTVMPRGP